MFAEDANNTAWTSGGGQVVGWLNTKKFLETGDEVASQGWTALILDTNGNGRRDDYVEPNEPLDPTKDKRINAPFYSVSPAPDGSVWGSVLSYPGAIVRLNPGRNPPRPRSPNITNCRSTIAASRSRGFRRADGHRSRRRRMGRARKRTPGEFRSAQSERPAQRPDRDRPARARGLDVLYRAVAATAGREDRRQRRGQLLHVGRSVRHLWSREKHAHQHRQRIRRSARVEGRQWVILRVPYPLGFYAKWMDGRIDDPKAGWKGRGLWACVSTRAPFHMETGKGTTSKVMHFQLRPDPLAK